MAFWTTLSFVFGAVCSGIAGLIGMFVAVRANIRTASAARSSLNRALQIALRGGAVSGRSEEHTSELQSRLHLVCRLLLEKKKTTRRAPPTAGLRVGAG